MYVEEEVRGSMYHSAVGRGGRIKVFALRGSYLPDCYQRYAQYFVILPRDYSPLQDLGHRLIGSDLRLLLTTLGRDSRDLPDLLDYLGGSMLIPLINRFSTQLHKAIILYRQK